MGIMLGDLLATLSVHICAQLDERPEFVLDMTHTMLSMQREVELGQVLDMADSSIALTEHDELIANAFEVYRWKTASYTTVAPLKFGLLCAGFSKEASQTWAEKIGIPLGIAFQLEDDLLDVLAGASEASGKPLGSDIREAKRTVLLADAMQALKSSDSSACQRLMDIYEKDDQTEQETDEAISLVRSSGAIEKSYQRIDDIWNRVKDLIEQFGGEFYVESAKLADLTQMCHTFVPHAHIR
jgi:geranylgeranyl diphosphate synthase type I